MKLNFRDIKKKQFSIEVEPSALVTDVKKQVAEHESAETSQIRLIHSGKVLADDKSVESYGIKETDHIICMVSKPKPPPVSQQPPSTPAQQSTTQTPAAPPPVPGSTTQNAPGTPTPAGAAAGPERRFDDTSPLMGPERQSAIASMEAMGFERPQIERAMRAAFFNPDRAVDFLINGIPDSVQRELDAAQARQAQGQGQGQGQGEQQSQTAQPPASGATSEAPVATTPAQPAGGDEPVNLFEQAAAQNTGRGSSGASTGAGTGARGLGGAGAGGGTGGGQGADLAFLRDNPMFQQLRGLVQAQPSMLESVLHQVSAANPQLAQLISQNPQQFLEMLTEGGGEGDEGVPLPPGARDISVTEEERDAIERLCNLGFERDLVIQAYFACDKNEELAANFLFDNQREEDE